MSLLSRSSNILRGSKVDIKGKVSIKNSDSINSNIIDISSKLIERQESIEQKIEEAESKYLKIIEKTEKEKNKILEEASLTAKEIEKSAYEKGHEQGLKNGYEDGYKESYEINMQKARRESQEIIEKADETLLNAQNLLANYIDDKRSEILNLSLAIAEHVLREKFEDHDVMNNMILNIIKEYELSNSVVIKVNHTYVNSLKNNIDKFRNELNIKDEFFVVEDNTIDIGNAVIINNSGKLIVGIDSVLNRIKTELL